MTRCSTTSSPGCDRRAAPGARAACATASPSWSPRSANRRSRSMPRAFTVSSIRRPRSGSRVRLPPSSRSSRGPGGSTRPCIRSRASIAASDLRITTRFDPAYVGTALWSVIHETGHVIYYNGVDRALERTPLFGSSSLGFDESQSRLWENWVGRGAALPGERICRDLRERFPEQLRRRSTPSSSTAPPTGSQPSPDPRRGRRGHLQPPHHRSASSSRSALFEGTSAPPTCPRRGTSESRDYLGIETARRRQGVLQDVHWAAALVRLLPHLLARQRDRRPALGCRSRRARRPRPPARRRRARAAARVSAPSGFTATDASFEPAEAIQVADRRAARPRTAAAPLRAKYGELYRL